ncbi:MAG: Type 1 glutamine amidotransferase-like domain-containing protein [Candidatus Vogelbacteria bacterium]|nr:Type 1 glutamine amidotransferase-like domain-containing protein [Candidatus Vogelbacteria bacterium]
MRLLLTSGGLTNVSIANALFELVGKKPEDTSLVFIPTAANAEVGDKSWFINDLLNLQKQNFKSVDIADIAAAPEEVWKSKMDAADVLFFGGGNTFYLMDWINRSGLEKILPEYLKSKVYVGLSAGSMVTNRDLALELSQGLYDEDIEKTENVPGLGYVDFYFLPHLNSEYFSKLRESNIRQAVGGISAKVYALDDQCALRVVDGSVDIVGGGKYLVLN